MNIKQKRKEQKVSQIRLALLTGISRYRISLHECAYFALPSKDIRKIKAALHELLTPRNAVARDHLRSPKQVSAEREGKMVVQ